MTTTTNAPACRDCRFWSMTLDEPDQQFGECRRRAPVPRDGTPEIIPATEWPETGCNDWCGEFQPREAARAKENNFKCARCGSEVWYELRIVEHNARDRERAAWDACANFGQHTRPADGAGGIWHSRERDRLYPLQERNTT